MRMYQVRVQSLRVRRDPVIPAKNQPDNVIANVKEGDFIEEEDNRDSYPLKWIQHRIGNKVGWSVVEDDSTKAVYLELVSPADIKFMKMPWISQLDNNARKANDCGQADVLMMARSKGLAEGLTVDHLSAMEPGLTTPDELVGLAGRLGFRLTPFNPNQNRPEYYLSRDYAVIGLFDYKLLGFPQHGLKTLDQGKHWLLMVGYSKTYYLVHDPLWLPSQNNGRGGQYLRLSKQNFERAAVRSQYWLAG